MFRNMMVVIGPCAPELVLGAPTRAAGAATTWGDGAGGGVAVTYGVRVVLVTFVLAPVKTLGGGIMYCGGSCCAGGGGMPGMPGMTCEAGICTT
mmetsp:Transcript_71038/g.217726  ORF Transcript_71038/g.217726 Transcript_71038/m.217726 type:complete len:94 (-) Transcript_71038:147-428(-)